MPILYLVLAVAGSAIALAGVLREIYVLIPVGFAMIVGAFFLFSRTNQDTPAPVKTDDSR